jgi:hypothetical protein
LAWGKAGGDSGGLDFVLVPEQFQLRNRFGWKGNMEREMDMGMFLAWNTAESTRFGQEVLPKHNTAD